LIKVVKFNIGENVVVDVDEDNDDDEEICCSDMVDDNDKDEMITDIVFYYKYRILL
jgi:hypothetical protein